MLVDLDDTIIDGSAVVACWEKACETGAPGLAPGEVLAEILRLREWFWSDPERHRQGRLDLAAAGRQITRMALASCREARQVVFPGAVDTLIWLREMGCRLALLTNGAADTQRRKIVRFQLEPLFDLILVEGELGFGKPDERIYQLALGQLAVFPRDTWMVGDHLEWDVAQPQKLGITGIWVDAARAGLPPSSAVSPDLVIGTLGELRHILS
jgi:putative hydrolase of the HAD superfamily